MNTHERIKKLTKDVVKLKKYVKRTERRIKKKVMQTIRLKKGIM